jgi:group II intron reverse transcriptase/maturase
MTRIADGSIINLLRLFLESGVMIGVEWEPSEVGSPQGGVISPLIANVYLDEFDQFMKERNHRIVRYADDIIILTRSEGAAINAQKQATHFLEKRLKLTINREKTHRVHCSEGIKYLGVVIHPRYTTIQDKKIAKIKTKIKQITRRNSPVNLKTVIRELNPVTRGFVNYFRVANCKGVLRSLMQWIRRRLRAKQMALWKKSGKLHRRLRQLGYKGSFKSIKMSSWRNAHSPLVCMAMENKWFDRMRLYNLEKVTTRYSVSDP